MQMQQEESGRNITGYFRRKFCVMASQAYKISSQIISQIHVLIKEV
jgi:hypothetical protein